MEFGVILPQSEIRADPSAVAAFAEAAEGAGYRYLMAYDHVLGADTTTRPGWTGAYSHLDQFHEPFVLFGWLAGRTNLELVTGVIVLPQRQTALVAKQAAEVDILTGGRFRLGVGVGWNEVEYESLGMPFGDRGRRYEEQVEVLRLLWTNDIVDYAGHYHRIDRAGILPRPIQRPIPIWMGSRAGAPVLRRIGRLADGWIANLRPGAGLEEALDMVRAAAEEADRKVSWQGVVDHAAGPEAIARQVDVMRRLGASYCSINTLRGGLSPAQHVDAIVAAADIVDVG